ncbi:hypothetical protein L6452_00549 [Arctium lappa]|uniref:Uncharacterized protein n=1 Tax=Arctium lappa TaxID=4217 RepID=A0ACB9FEH3_ARCLA|nr:hypothetical protein L6452_00549 [Arctium lappa]
MFDRSGTPKPNTIYFSPSKPVNQTLTFLSGPSLATVDANVNSLGEKVVSRTAAVNDTTNTVNTAGTELKTLIDACSTKAESSHISAFKEELVKVKEDTQRKFDALSSKVDSCTTILQQVLDKLNAPAPTPSPSFTSDDRTSLNVAVEFIHQDTSNLPVIEGRLDSLEAKVRKLASTQPSSSTKDLSLDDNDKRGRKQLKKIKRGKLKLLRFNIHILPLMLRGRRLLTKPLLLSKILSKKKKRMKMKKILILKIKRKSNLIKKMMMMTMKKISPYGVLLQPSHLQ